MLAKDAQTSQPLENSEMSGASFLKYSGHEKGYWMVGSPLKVINAHSKDLRSTLSGCHSTSKDAKEGFFSRKS